MGTESRVFFTLHHYNETDHRAPVIHKFSQLSDVSTDVILCTRKLQGDYRVQYLDSLEGVNVYHVDELSESPDNSKTSSSNLGAKLAKNVGTHLMSTVESLGSMLPNTLPKDLIWKKTGAEERLARERANKIIDRMSNFDESVLIHDWSEKKINEYVSKQTDFPCACLPHGDSPYMNAIFSTNRVNCIDRYESKLFSHQSLETVCEGNDRSLREQLYRHTFFPEREISKHNHIVVPNEITAERYRLTTPKEKLHVLGSPRYTNEWIKIIDKIQPEPEIDLPESEKLNIVLFDRDPGLFVSQERILDTIKIVSCFQEVNLIVKEHTSGRLLPDDSPIKNWNNIKVVGEEVHSPALLNWGDVFINAGTSIVFESILKNKPVISAEYVHANKSTTSHFLPGTTVNTLDDLYEQMSRMIITESTTTYTQTERDDFIDNMLVDPDNNLRKYVNFIQDLLRSQSV